MRRFAARGVDALLKAVIVMGSTALLWLAALEHVQQRIDDAAASGQTVTVWLIDLTTGALLVQIAAVALLVGALYEVLPTAKWGRTIGKRLLRITVVDIETREPPGFGRAASRYLTRLAMNVMIIGLLVGSFWPIADRPWRQGWHDKVARTFVALDNTPRYRRRPQWSRSRRPVGPLARWLDKPVEIWPERSRTRKDPRRRLDLVELTDRPETATAVGSIETTLERVFQTLGPPPEGLCQDKEPVVHGGGGNTQ